MRTLVAAPVPGLPEIPCTPVQAFHCWPTQRAEYRQLSDISWIDLAHVVMLVEHGTIPRHVGQKLLPVLQQINKQGLDSSKFDFSKESLLYQVEKELSDELGDYVAGSMHTARSRIDQRATVGRIFHRNQVLQVLDRIQEVQDAFINTAKRHISTTFPYHTHTQQSQPGNYAHYLLAYVSKLQDDFERLQTAFSRLNRNPLGTVGRSGTGIRINRQRTTELLAFDDTIRNSLLGKDADYALDVVASLSLVMSHINDFATDIQLWSTNEFGFLQLPDSFCERSSLFPQKRNPVTLEAIKLNAGPSVAWLTGALSTARGLGSGDHSLHGIPSNMEQALEITSNMLTLTGLVVDAAKLNERRIKEVLTESWSTTSNLSDTLIQNHGLSMRQAYGVVSYVVKHCRENNVSKSAVSPDLLRQAGKEVLGQEIRLSQEQVHLALDPEAFVQTRISSGSVGPTEVNILLADAEQLLIENRQWLAGRRLQQEKARLDLDVAIQAILNTP